MIKIPRKGGIKNTLPTLITKYEKFNDNHDPEHAKSTV